MPAAASETETIASIINRLIFLMFIPPNIVLYKLSLFFPHLYINRNIKLPYSGPAAKAGSIHAQGAVEGTVPGSALCARAAHPIVKAGEAQFVGAGLHARDAAVLIVYVELALVGFDLRVYSPSNRAELSGDGFRGQLDEKLPSRGNGDAAVLGCVCRCAAGPALHGVMPIVIGDEPGDDVELVCRAFERNTLDGYSVLQLQALDTDHYAVHIALHAEPGHAYCLGDCNRLCAPPVEVAFRLPAFLARARVERQYADHGKRNKERGTEKHEVFRRALPFYHG